MPRSLAALLFASCLSAPALAADPHAILDANRIASGGAAWAGKSTLELEYAYSGQGLTGTLSSLQDLVHGGFVDSYDFPPTAGANGYDGAHAWEKEPSGTIADQAGGDMVPLAITEFLF